MLERGVSKEEGKQREGPIDTTHGTTNGKHLIFEYDKRVTAE
jgi:hypothetical protein